jgi:hypothetical protein
MNEEQKELIWNLDRLRDRAEEAQKDIAVVRDALTTEISRRQRLLDRFIQSTKDRKEEIICNTSLFRNVDDVRPTPETQEVMDHPTRGITHAL